MTRSDGSKQLERLRDLKVRRRQKMNDLDKVYAESVAKEYMPKETNKVRLILYNNSWHKIQKDIK